MGHRANFVLIRDNAATAYCDRWAALGCTYSFSAGPAAAEAAAQTAEVVDELLNWAFAEAGFLLDFDQKQAIVFGYPEPFDFEEGALEGLEGLADPPQTASAELVELDAALQRGPLDFLSCIAPKWRGWHLHWDERGVDAFASYLESRGITNIAVQPPSHPSPITQVSLQA